MEWTKFKQAKEKSLFDAIAKDEADKAILPLLKKINKHVDLVATSSCYGRIVLLEFDWEKRESRFYRKWHSKIKVEDVDSAVKNYKGKHTLWFKFEPFILHVAAKDVESAKNFLETIRKIGVKRGGIQTITAEKLMIEVQGNNQLILPAKAVSEWKPVVGMANKMFERNANKITELEKAF